VADDVSGTLLMISHDREFLDAIIDRVLHIENRAIRAYSGNYSQFEQKRAEELALQQTLQARQIAAHRGDHRLREPLSRQATKSRQAQSRLKMLERMERIVPAHVDSPFEFEFAAPLKTPRPLLTSRTPPAATRDAHRRRDQRYPSVRRTASRCSGRTARQVDADENAGGRSGAARRQAHRRRGFERRLLRAAADGTAAPDCDAFWHLRNLGGPDFASGDEQRVRDHLGRFGFEGDRAFEPVGDFRAARRRA
jgi:ATP-binding cassette subfamily F protein 3